MPPEARVLIIEDDKNWRELFCEILGLGRHTVAGEITMMSELHQLDLTGIDVALVDGNLHPDDDSGSDGKEIVKHIKKVAPHVKTVGVSASNNIDGADANVSKPNAAKKLSDTINRL